MGLRRLGRLWGILSVIAFAGVLLCVAALRVRPLFGWAAARAAARFSADGIVSAEGRVWIRGALASLGGFLFAAAVASAAVARLLARLGRGVLAPDAPQAAEAHQPQGWWTPTRSAQAALILVAIAAVIRVPRLFTSLFYDEIFTIQHFVTRPFFTIPFAQIGANNHILNSLLLAPLVRISSAEAFVRLPAYLAGLLSLWLLFRVGQRMAGGLIGLLALLGAATSPYHLWYSTLARGYMPGLCLSLFGLWTVLRAGSPPNRASRWMFGISQVLASWAMPTAALVPIALAGFLLPGVAPSWRARTGIDPRTPTGSAWLVTSLWTTLAVGFVNLPTLPFLILQASRSDARLGGSLAEGAEWLGIFSQGAIAAAAGIGLILAGGLIGFTRLWRQRPWPVRWTVSLLAIGIAGFAAKPSPGRIHVIAFSGVAVFAALGLRQLLEAVVTRNAPVRLRTTLAGLGSVAAAAVLIAASWGELVHAAAGMPLQDIRRAVQLAESTLPADHGTIVTSGFTAREIAYYATRPVTSLAADAKPAELIATQAPFCYFRLYATASEDDPVFRSFSAFARPWIVVSGRDPISIWCFRGR